MKTDEFRLTLDEPWPSTGNTYYIERRHVTFGISWWRQIGFLSMSFDQAKAAIEEIREAEKIK